MQTGRRGIKGKIMKRKAIIVIAILALCTAAIYAAVAGAAAKPVLSFEGRNAICRFSLSAPGDPLKAVLELRHGEALVGTWEADGEGYLLLEGTCRVTPGETYELSAAGNIGKKTFKTVSVTATCPEGDGNAPVFVDPQQRDWEKISAAAKALLASDEKAYCANLEYLGLVLPEAYAKNTEQAEKAITLILNSAAEGNWGAYDHTELAELQERILDVLENQMSITGVGFYEDKGGVPGENTGNVVFEEFPGLENMKFQWQEETQTLLVTGTDARYMAWTPQGDLIVGSGRLYFGDPRFAHPYFEGGSVEGTAQWEPGPYSFSKYTMLSYTFTVAGSGVDGDETGPSVSCLVDLAYHKVISKSVENGDWEAIGLSDEDLLRIAEYFSFVLSGAQNAWTNLSD